MPFNIKSSGSFYAIFDDSPLSSNRTYILPNTGGVLITSTITGSFSFTSSHALTASHILGGGGASVTSPGNDRILTSDGTTTGLIAETNIIFSASMLRITGSISASQYTGSNVSGIPAFIGLATSASLVQMYTTTTSGQTWTKPSWAQRITVIAIGGGGGGGGGYSGTNGFWKSGGGGGAASEIVFHTYAASDLPNTAISLQIGVGGTGGIAPDPGNTGGDTKFGSNSETNYPVLISRGGYGGYGGVSTNATNNSFLNITRCVPGRPSSINSTGGGGGGYGVPNQSLTFGGMRPEDAPNLPYTLNDCYLQSYRFLGANNTTNLSLLGVPAAVAPTGGGGGMGAGTNNVGVNVTRAGYGGAILNVNDNSGGRTGANVVNDFKSPGIINDNWPSGNPPNMLQANSLLKFIRHVKVGIGGNGGFWTSNPLVYIAATTGSDYGGGGGGGGYNNNGAKGGNGAIIIISEA